jgi:hypothetical protein
MSPDILTLVLVPIYLLVGTFGIALLMNWVLKRFGSPKK